MKKIKKTLTISVILLILGGCTAETTSYYLEYHKWVPIQQSDSSDSSLKNQKKEVKVPSQ